MLPLTSVESLQDVFPKSYCQVRHQLQLVQNKTHTAFYSIVDCGVILRKYAIFMLITRKDFPEYVKIALVHSVPVGTILPLPQIPEFSQQTPFGDIATIKATPKKIKFYFKSKEKKKWRAYPANEAVRNDWADLLKIAIHRENLLKTTKYTTLKVGWEQFRAKMAQPGGEEVHRESERFKEEKQQALKEVGYSLQMMAKCYVKMKRSKAQVKQQFSTWKSEYKTTIDEYNQIKLISEILSGNEMEDCLK